MKADMSKEEEEEEEEEGGGCCCTQAPRLDPLRKPVDTFVET